MSAVALIAGVVVVQSHYDAASPRYREYVEKFRSQVGEAGQETREGQTASEQYAQARTAPGGYVNPGAYGAAYTSLATLPPTAGAWSEVYKPYNSDDLRYRDPVASNSTGGSGYVAGRMTGLTVTQAGGQTVLFAGGADGGIFRKIGGGAWTPIADGLPTLSVGDLAFGPDGALWLATGEGNTGATSYVGSGVYRLPNAASALSVFTPADRVGGNELESTFIQHIRFGNGYAWAATSRGAWRHVVGSNAGSWEQVFTTGSTNPYQNIVNDIAVQAGTNKVVINAAWRGGAAYNGFYYSTTGGTAGSFVKANPGGAINPKVIGNSTFAYSADGKKLYVVIEDTQLYNSNQQTGNSVLAGVYVSNTGDVNGPWNTIADYRKLANAGSALKGSKGYSPGVQAWFNQFLTVDPANNDHVFLGLEEVFETTNGGSSWVAAAPYWNFSFSCWSFDPAKNTCPQTTHSDQHSVAIGNGTVYVGNDGGVYARGLGGGTWSSSNLATSFNNGLDSLQYYSVGVGTGTNGDVYVSGGLQDNGQSLLRGNEPSQGSPFGGDGGYTLVDPRPGKGCNIAAEYVNLYMQVTNNCGESDGTTTSIRVVAPGDPGARFIAPFDADSTNPDSWIAGGEFVYTQDHGYAIKSGAEWNKAFDLGVGHASTAVAKQGRVWYAAWCGPCNNAGFTRGMATNYGGTAHQLTLASAFPNRYIAGVTIDPADTTGGTAYAVINGFSRRWTEGPGAGIGHLFKTTDGGGTWAEVGAGTLPDVPANSLIINGGKLVLGTDLGVLVSSDGGATWKRLGGNFPLTTVMQVHNGPDGNIYAATHGRGIWKIAASTLG